MEYKAKVLTRIKLDEKLILNEEDDELEIDDEEVEDNSEELEDDEELFDAESEMDLEDEEGDEPDTSEIPLSDDDVEEINEPFENTDTDIELDNAPEMPEATEEDANRGLAFEINSAINNAWNSVSDYNSLIANANATGADDKLIVLLQAILEDEMIHIGQLQTALTLVSPEAEAIELGKEKAEEIINGEEPSDLELDSEEDVLPPENLDLEIEEPSEESEEEPEEFVLDGEDEDNEEDLKRDEEGKEILTETGEEEVDPKLLPPEDWDSNPIEYYVRQELNGKSRDIKCATKEEVINSAKFSAKELIKKNPRLDGMRVRALEISLGTNDNPQRKTTVLWDSNK